MGDIGFFLILAVITMVTFGVSETLAMRRRRKRRELLDKRTAQSDEVFTVGVSALSPVTQGFVRAFRLAAGRALGVDHSRLLPSDRIARDLKCVNFDAWELAAVLERAFDVRVKVIDVMRSETLRDLCKVIYARTEEPSEYTPPLHRDPVPKQRAPEPEVVVTRPAEIVDQKRLVAEPGTAGESMIVVDTQEGAIGDAGDGGGGDG